jgi:hypothetical protein
MAVPAMAQESTEQLKKELQELRAEVEGLKAVNQTKEIPAQGKIDANAMAADDNPLMTLFKGTKLSGFVDVGYEFSFNTLNTDRVGAGVGSTLNNGHNPTRIFDNRDNSFYMHEAHLQLERLASKDMIVGYHIELGAGHDPSIYDGQNVTLQEGWVQILAPLGAGLDIRAGKMATLAGYEVLENVNNMNYSRGMLFGLIQPFTNTGVRVAYGMGGSNNDMATFTLGFNNGLNSTAATAPDLFSDGDHGKAVELQVAVKPIKDLLASVTLITGNDTVSGVNVSTADQFYLFDIVVAYTMDKMTFALNVDFASAQQSTDLAGPAGTKTRTPTSGFAVYGKYAWTDAMATALRFEYFSDKNGSLPLLSVPGERGTGARTAEITLTQEIKVANQLIIRIEVRHDDCNDHIFRRDTKAAKGDNTLGFEAIMPF